MLTKVSSKGQTVIPSAIREMARLKAGDELEVGYSGGMIFMRKKQRLTPAKMRALLLAGRRLPPMKPADDTAVRQALQRVRGRAAQ